MKRPGFCYVIVDAMLRTGLSPEEMGRSGGGNFVRVSGEGGITHGKGWMYVAYRENRD